jgi:hypothetical protein
MAVARGAETAIRSSSTLFGWLAEGTPAARRGLLAAWLGWMLDGFDIMLYALVLGTLLQDFAISTRTAGLLICRERWYGSLAHPSLRASQV